MSKPCKKPCATDEICNPASGRCVKRSGKIGKTLSSSPKKGSPKKASPKKASPKKASHKEKPCKKPCAVDEICNPASGICVKRSGKIGKDLTTSKNVSYTNRLGQFHREGDLPAIERSSGTKEWWVNGQRHRDGGLPATELGDGDKYWWVNGQLHRGDDLPAIELTNGQHKAWYVNGKRHRGGDLPAIMRANGEMVWYVNGERHRGGYLPAIVRPNGDKEWWVNGQLHCEGGLPAIERGNGTKEWYLNGRKMTKKEVIDYMVFCKKVKERRAQKKIYFWWIPICYDMEHKSGCGQRMAQKNVDVYKSMMNN